MTAPASSHVRARHVSGEHFDGAVDLAIGKYRNRQSPLERGNGLI